MRSRRALPIWALLAIALLPAASAAGTATATPDAVAPGDPLTIVLHIPSPGAVELAVQERVTCTLGLTAGGPTVPCGPDQTTTDARVTPGEMTYAFSTTAPAVAGAYTATLQRTSTLTAPPTVDTAEVQIIVRLEESNLVPTGSPNATGNETLPATDGIAGADAGRYFASSTMAVAAIGAGVTSRFSWRKP